jgi:uncharacterized protein (DUF1330 family)
MRQACKLAAITLITFGVDVIASSSVYPQTNTPPAYFIAEVEVHDAEAFKPYAAQVGPAVTSYGGRFLVGGGKAQAIEGAPPASRVVVIEFPSMEKALEFDRSPEYGKIKPIRQASATSRIFVVEGRPPN